MGTKLLGYILLCLGGLIVLYALYWGTHQNIPLVFSPTQMLASLWNDYKLGYIEDHRTVDRQRDNVTTSEGQSYTMLRAVWMGDKDTFDAAWQWTKDNLGRNEDRLSSWLFGQQPDGTYRVLTAQGGHNSAADAEVDLALALIFANMRWQNSLYMGDARTKLDAVWAKEVLMIGGRPYLVANDLEKFSTSNTALINPSYVAPYAFRIFAQVDPAHDWAGLIDTSYEVLEQSLSAEGLPPDWVEINKTTGALSAPRNGLSEDFSYDALRVPWRIALDWQWYAEPRAKSLLEKMHGLGAQWQQYGQLFPVSSTGQALAPESPALYGGAIGYFMAVDPQAAKEVYEKKLQFLYDPTVNRFTSRLSYYDDNWAWFGIALYHNLLPNLTAGVPHTLLEM